MSLPLHKFYPGRVPPTRETKNEALGPGSAYRSRIWRIGALVFGPGHSGADDELGCVDPGRCQGDGSVALDSMAWRISLKPPYRLPASESDFAPSIANFLKNWKSRE